MKRILEKQQDCVILKAKYYRLKQYSFQLFHQTVVKKNLNITIMYQNALHNEESS